MKLSVGLLLPALVGVARASAAIEAYTFSPSKPPTAETVDLSPEQFRLVIAQRLGLSRYHSISNEAGEVDSEIVQIISRLGRHRDLFSGDTNASQDLVLALYTTDEEADGIRAELDSHRYKAPAFSLIDSPGSHFEGLIDDLSAQSKLSSESQYAQDLTSVQDLLEDQEGPLVVKHITEPGQFRTHSQVDNLFKLVGTGKLEVTILLVSESAVRTSTGAFRTKQDQAWGKYIKPDSANGRRQFEAPMSDAFVDKVFGSSAEATADVSKSETSPLRKLPLVCYASIDACNNATNSCSGHGECYRKFGPVAGDSGPTCFACACKATYDKATGTSYWGGAACQKRDISAQFWIILGFSLLLIGLVGWAIGMMFSIGNEKLPGVIGAGVAPKTR